MLFSQGKTEMLFYAVEKLKCFFAAITRNAYLWYVKTEKYFTQGKTEILFYTGKKLKCFTKLKN
jgi:hypothetical protein